MDALATRLPGTVALVVAGLVIGSIARLAGAGPIDVPHELVLIVLLPGLVFEAAYRLQLDVLRRWISGLALLAVPGVIVSAGVVALSLTALTGLRLDLAFIAGAIVSATDPAAVVATFKRIPTPKALATIVDGESLLNDGTGLVLFSMAVAALATPIGAADAVLGFVGCHRDQRRDRRGRRRARERASSAGSTSPSSSWRSRSSSPTAASSSRTASGCPACSPRSPRRSS